MEKRAIDATHAPGPVGGYAQAIEGTGAKRILDISGQIPMPVDGAVPEGFKAQCRNPTPMTNSYPRASRAEARPRISKTPRAVSTSIQCHKARSQPPHPSSPFQTAAIALPHIR